ncbi:MAG: MATE family efflux transporter [Lachnospiraceae bacterium]|nr:MATE family efflux transporter [Lachnospiraceae bacterium]
MTQEEKFIKMTTEPVPKLVGTLAVPTIISMLVTSFYNMADTYFVGKLNTSATAAVGVVFSLMAVIQAFGFLFGHGAGNFMARKLGEKNREEASQIANAGFFFCLVFGIIFMIAGLIFVEPLAYFLGSTETILPYAVDYMRIILFGSPYMMASFVLNNQMRYQGNAMYAMVGILVGAVLNIGLDPLLIFGLDMGIKGAAWATIISQAVSFLLLLGATRIGGNIPITLKRNPFVFRLLPEICMGGLPSLCRQGIASISVILLNTSARDLAFAHAGDASAVLYADAAIAGMSIVSRITMFANSALIGFGQGFQPVCSFNYGAKIYKRVKDSFWFCVKTSLIFLLVVAVLGFIFAPNLVELMRDDDPLVSQIGSFALRAQCITFPLNAWIVMCNMLLQACGQSVSASLVASCRQGICFIPMLYVLPAFFDFTGLMIAQPVADVFTLVISMGFGLYFLKKLQDTGIKGGE